MEEVRRLFWDVSVRWSSCCCPVLCFVQWSWNAVLHNQAAEAPRREKWPFLHHSKNGYYSIAISQELKEAHWSFLLTHWVVGFSILPQMKRRRYSQVAQVPVVTINVVIRPPFSTPQQWPPLWWFAHSWSGVEMDSSLPGSPIKLVFCGLVTQCSHLQERLRW